MIKAFLRNIFPKGLWQKMSEVKWPVLVVVARFHHWRVLQRIRRKIGRGEKLRVAFVESEIAKWKTQSLFDLMKADEHYEPFMLICKRDRDETKGEAEIRRRVNESLSYFRRQGNDCIDALDMDDLNLLNIRKFNPDIIFYQQSWFAASIFDAVKFALPCYVPYYVANYGSIDLDSKLLMHRFLAYFFMQSEAWVSALTAWAPWYYYSGKMLPFGHTMLDYAYLNPPHEPKSQCVIYAPHFSIRTEKVDNLTGISTFLWNGLEILEYAKKHPEMSWVFKPHPILYRTLIESNLMDKKSVDQYYLEWENLGVKCTDNNYTSLFTRATVMITDCGSFLTEFGATGKPIIHLISSMARVSPMKPSQELYATYYQVHNLDEMYATFETVLEKQEDPNKETRQAAVRKAGLRGNYAAKNIMEFFDKEFRIKR